MSKTPPKPAKRPYRAPQLTEYGNIAKLTRGSNGSFADMGAGGGFQMDNGMGMP